MTPQRPAITLARRRHLSRGDLDSTVGALGVRRVTGDERAQVEA
ncbi:hypothetical protein FHS43_006396 [Streptosporangium becharense]|uniref:Uncharacterized protein n=1 Tax=Streptosporangium becharense TaxID=1816182 RepID=A0A7W9MJ41_9ACTN|nr:hypothetical protein [Streptosporangium becharense]MBB2915076.1 hypothetical protein [Streptosporangium becharense]MBB5822852.1 hypothetical protein [Streptosporangium becharense]